MKLLIKLSIAVIVLVFAGIVLLLVLVNPNDYKPQIEAQVKQSINRDLHIKGDIGWTFFPQLGFSSGQIELDNLQGFDKPHLVKVNEAAIGINILPLLKGQISLGELILDGFEVTLLTAKDGSSNMDNMGPTEKSSATDSTTEEITSPASDSEASSFFDMSKTELAGISINNAIIEIEDLQTGSYQKIAINEIKLGQFALNKETPLSINTKLIIDDLQAQITLSTMLLVNTDLSEISLKALQLDTDVSTDALPNGGLKSTLKTDIIYLANSKKVTLDGVDINTVISGDNLPNKKVTTQLNADINYQLNNQLASINNLKLMIDQLTLDGELSVQTGQLTKVRYALVANEWDLNPYLPKTEQSTSSTSDQKTGTNEKSAEQEVEPDLSFLNGLDIDGTLKIAGLMVEKIKIGEINKHLIINKGKAQLKPLTAQLYDGLLTLNGNIDASKGLNKYQVSTQLKGVQLRPLLTDAAEVDLLSGNTNFNFNGKGQGLTTSKIKQGITGKGNFSLLDGELYGVNIPQEIRTIKAKLKGQSAPSSDSIKKTDFASLKGDFSIAKGLVNNQKLLMLSPVMRLDGSGLVHIIEETLDYKLSITPLSKSTEDTDYVDLTGITIPMLIKGSFTDPSISLDTDGALKEHLKTQLDAEKQRLNQKAQEALKGELDSESIKKEGKRLEDKLKSFF
ncbi:cell envelope biogenesis protein AsmA [Psychromonas marina]|uniref:Cell envelope biogenesis protein AsmA n=1 Tax=Psychromonas marina TaxID=88364 RepID=A0ABQ6DX74_9GAMM|nr:AsmA family protein [Psychromonas marina]GLS89763.1 cell envelope biogenesis protein AsmA [Psychromonas marina]